MQTSAREEGYGLMQTKADKGGEAQRGSIFVVFLCTPFMDNPKRACFMQIKQLRQFQKQLACSLLSLQ